MTTGPVAANPHDGDNKSGNIDDDDNDDENDDSEAARRLAAAHEVALRRDDSDFARATELERRRYITSDAKSFTVITHFLQYF